MKKINESYKLIVFAALALALVLYIGNIWSGLQSLTSVFSPIILGGVLAFIFNVPMKKLEDFLDKCRVPQKLQRGLALVLEVLILALIMTGIVSIVVPTLTTAVNQLSATIGKVAPQVAKWLQQSGLLSSSQLKDLTKTATLSTEPSLFWAV